MCSKNIKFKIYIFCLILFIFFSCEKEKKYEKTEKKVNNQKQSKIIINKFTFTDSSKGKLNWILSSNKAIINNKKKIIDLHKVKIIYKNKYIILSPKGKYFMNDKIAKLYDSVKILNDNTTFLTNSLTFYGKINKIETDKKMRIENPQFCVTANSLIGFIDKNRYILKGKVKSIIR